MTRQAIVRAIEMNDNPNDPTVGLVLQLLPDRPMTIKELNSEIETTQRQIERCYDGEMIDVLQARKSRQERQLADLILSETNRQLCFNVSGFKTGSGPLQFNGESCNGVDISDSQTIIDENETIIDLTKLPAGTKYLRIWGK